MHLIVLVIIPHMCLLHSYGCKVQILILILLTLHSTLLINLEK
nr:MAG TPA: hypothetical protein [Caudoviricetes sp.]